MPWVPVGNEGAASNGFGTAPGKRKSGPKNKAQRSADSDLDWRGRQSVSAASSPKSGPSHPDVEPAAEGPPAMEMTAATDGETSRPNAIWATKTRRMAWADMASDESGSEDMFGLGPSSPSSSSAAAKARQSGPADQEHPPKAAENATDTSKEEPSAQASQEEWVNEVLAMAGRMQELVASAPSAERVRRFCEYAATEVTMADVDLWADAAADLKPLEVELQQARVEQAKVQEEVEAAERLWNEAKALVSTQAAQLDEEKSAGVLEDQRRALELYQATAALEAANSACEVSSRDASRQGEQRQASLDALRKQLAAELEAAEAAEEEVTRTISAREARKALPELRKRRKASEANKDKAESACKQAKTSVEQLRADLTAAKDSADSRAAPLEARRAQLESDCSELQQSLAAPLPAELSKVADKDHEQKLQAELKAQQARNGTLLASVRKLRDARGTAKGQSEAIKKEVADLCKATRTMQSEGLDLEQQAKELKEKENAVRAEVTRLEEQIRHAEKQVQESEEKAKNDRAKQAEVEAAKRGLQLTRRRTEEAATVLEWRLQKAAMQLEKDKPGTSLVKHLLNSDGQARIGLQRPHHSKRYGAGKGLSTGGSDAELESTTAASETVAECWP